MSEQERAVVVFFRTSIWLNYRLNRYIRGKPWASISLKASS